MNRVHQSIDWAIVVLYTLLAWVGISMIYSVTRDVSGDSSFLDLGTQHGKQTLVWFISIIAGVTCIIIDSKFFQVFAKVFYGIGIVLLVAVLFVASETKGAQSWFEIGSFKFQPSEAAKLCTALGLSSLFSAPKFTMKTWGNRLIAIGMFMLPCVLIVIQGDAGSALVFFSFFLVLLVFGMPSEYYVLAILSAVIAILALVLPPFPLIAYTFLLGAVYLSVQKRSSLYWNLSSIALAVLTFVAFKYDFIYYLVGVNFLWLVYFSIRNFGRRSKYKGALTLVVAVSIGALVFSVSTIFNNVLESHQKDRINSWLQPSKADPQGAYYNVKQSKIAIGSGGFSGKGYLNGSLTKYDFIPEQSTDFIFCSVGEQQGFLGTSVVIILFLLLMLRLVFLSQRQKSRFSKAYLLSIAGIIFFHFLINIGMTVGVMPVIGIPLPFISYGGSSLLSFSIMLAIGLRLDMDRLEFR